MFFSKNGASLEPIIGSIFKFSPEFVEVDSTVEVSGKDIDIMVVSGEDISNEVLASSVSDVSDNAGVVFCIVSGSIGLSEDESGDVVVSNSASTDMMQSFSASQTSAAAISSCVMSLPVTAIKWARSLINRS